MLEMFLFHILWGIWRGIWHWYFIIREGTDVMGRHISINSKTDMDVTLHAGIYDREVY